MLLRNYKKEDGAIIAGWLRSEEELYKWSADRFNKYPLSGNDINENYTPQLETRRFCPLTAVDDNGDVLGHFIIRYPRVDDDSSVRFGFVIVRLPFKVYHFAFPPAMNESSGCSASSTGLVL